MYITKITLERIRGFGDETLCFIKNSTKNKVQPRMRTVILGKNGTCKTTLLRCIAIGLSDEGDASGLITEPVGTLIAEGKDDAKITIELSPDNGGTKTTVVTTKLIKRKNGEDSIEDKKWKPKQPDQLFLCGYGAGRSSEGSDIRRPYRIIDSVYTLFWYDESLIGTELTMRRLRDYRGSKFYDRTMNGIKKALGLKPTVRFNLPRGGGITVSGPTIGKNIPLEGWADGYRMTFNWILDLYAWAMKAGCITDTGGVEGIVLIDEVDQHLHPSIQATILNRLSKMCSDLQIIATTHSPMVTLGAKPSEVIALKRKGKKVVINDIPDFQGCSVEDMISNVNLFDSDIYSPETIRMLSRFRKLASIPSSKRTKLQKAQLKSLRIKLEAHEILEEKESKIDKKLSALIDKYQL